MWPLRLWAYEAESSFAENRFGIGSDCATHFPTAEHAIFTSELNPSDPFACSKQMSFNFQPFQVREPAKADIRVHGPRVSRILFVQ
jgi:hypothetical protein